MDTRLTRLRSRWRFGGQTLLIATLLAACAGPPATECVWAKPILVGRDDALTAGTTGQIVAHNRKWAAFCER